MHRTSFQKMVSFSETYIKPAASKQRVSVLDVGSKSYLGHESYKDAIGIDGLKYVGLDLEAGENVDVVPRNAFVWDEFGDEEFDFCISGQTFEHNPYFWVTFAEIARVLKPGGTTCLIAPGRGDVHRYPFDCWRFFPDSWSSLCSYCGLELLESYFEDNGDVRAEPGLYWCDSCVIARKPVFASTQEADAFYDRIRAITATIPSGAPDVVAERNPGPCLQHYLDNNHYKSGFLKRCVSAARSAFKELTR